MKTNRKAVKPVKLVKKSRRITTTATRRSARPSRSRLTKRFAKPVKELSLLEKIAQATDELQMLRSRLANAGDDLPAVGIHRITALEHELEKLWEMRRHEQAAPLRQTTLSEQEERELAFPSGGRGRV